MNENNVPLSAKTDDAVQRFEVCVMRSMGCRLCEFWAVSPKDLSMGECRKTVPKTFLIVGPKGPEIISGFALMPATGWCGEGKPRLDAEAH